MDEGRTGDLVFFTFDLLFLNGENTAGLPLIERKDRLEALFSTDMPRLRFSEHVIGNGPTFREHACRLALEGVVSKRIDRPYAPGDRRPVGEVEMPQPRGIRRRRLDRPDREPSAYRLATSRLLNR